ncbi:MAG TPA: hypothetical protein PK385_07785 [Spirochaetota bacterium]|nr:hypothetical protein [Spirochaetota bacterium]HOS32610.1 hypothetical protein [Spirochaetota bacterium]HOS55943.1 hypothetical protein [Spirochaetota bacterium]HQF77947.1 hypothetical protein [Spirochaetota bacterium]HQH31661.1 hypothetical protein [Spirochaetota bacterium]
MKNKLFFAVLISIFTFLYVNCPNQDAPAKEDNSSVWDATVDVKVGSSVTEVNLKNLDKVQFNGMESVRLTRIVEVIALEKPWRYVYNFISNDNFDPLTKLGNDIAQLPVYGELDYGYLCYDSSDDYFRIYWDKALNFSGKLSVKNMNYGTINVIEAPLESLIVHTPSFRVNVDYSDMTRDNVVDYKHPDDGAVPMLSVVSIFEKGGITDAASCSFKIYGEDGFSNSDDNLMPYINMEHAYLKLSDSRITFADESYDTTACCWRIKNTVYIKGINAQ